MVCLDTDFLIELARKNVGAHTKISSLTKTTEMVYTTTINMAEFYSGIYNSKKGWSEERTKRFFDSFGILTLDNEAARLFGKLNSQMRSNSIGDLDLLVAAIALSNNQVLITKNKKHFERVPGLQIEDW